MRHQILTRLRHLLVAIVICISAIAPYAPNTTASAGLSPTSTPMAATQLPATAQPDASLPDSPVADYTPGVQGLTDLKLYNSPVGLAGVNSWQFRNLQLQPAGPGVVSPVTPLGQLRIATGGSGTLATLASDDGGTLGVGLAGSGGQATAALTGRATTGAVQFTSSGTTAGDLAIIPAAGGFTLRYQLRTATAATQFSLRFSHDQGTDFRQEPDGTILLERPTPEVSPDGSVRYTLYPAEFVLRTPSLTDSNSDPFAASVTGPITMTLQPGTGTAQDVAISIDPAWLHDPRRTFPANVDLQVLTAYAAGVSGQFGTISNCAPGQPAAPVQMAVGTEGRCSYEGQAYFDVGSLLPDTPVQSATLHLYSPNLSTPTGVQVYANRPATSGAPATAPSWATAPAIDATLGPSTESAAGGHWHTWDVTQIVQGWIRDSRTNAGFRLVGTGAPAIFASPFNAAQVDPATAPYLEITYAARPQAVAADDDGATSIYGLAGAFTASDSACVNRTCHQALKISTVANGQGTPPAGEFTGPGGAYIRFAVPLDCVINTPDYDYWSSASAANGNNGTTFDLLQQAYSDNLIPIINFTAGNDPTCVSFLGATATNGLPNWQEEMVNFVDTLKLTLGSTPGMTYFEIGNEENINNDAYYGVGQSPDGIYYAEIFAAAATSLYREWLSQFGAANLRILTGGMLAPTTADTSTCGHQSGADWAGNFSVAQLAITSAHTEGVPYTSLGAAVHPYSYNTTESNDQGVWSDYYHDPIGRFAYAGGCSDLAALIHLWVDTFAASLGMVVVFSEDNYSTGDANACTNKSDYYAYCTGAYLAGLMTWLHRYGFSDPANSPVRVMWFRGTDDPAEYTANVQGTPTIYHGIYALGYPLPLGGHDGDEKTLSLPLCVNPAINPNAVTLSAEFYDLRSSGCDGSTTAPTPTVTSTATTTATATGTPTASATPTGTATGTATPTATPGGSGVLTTTISLAAGWNLISLPLAPATPLDARTVLTTLFNNTHGSYAEIDRYSNGQFAPSLYDDLGDQLGIGGTNFTLQPGQGYALYTNTAGSITVTGTPISTATALPLAAGWNLIGFPDAGTTTYKADTVLTGLIAATHGRYAEIDGYTDGQFSPSAFDDPGEGPGLGGSNVTIQPGQGYALYTDVGTTLDL